MLARTDCASVVLPDAKSLLMLWRSLRKGLSELLVLLVLVLELLALFDEASFSRAVSAVLASVVFPDCRAVPRVFNSESILDVLDVELSEEVLPVLDGS